MKLLQLLTLFILLNSCSKQGKIKKNQGSLIKNDTIIYYDLEEISLEGTEVKVLYSNDTINKATINIYGETGQNEIIYIFNNDIINVEEKVYQYEEPINVSSGNKPHLKSYQKYTMNYEGEIENNDDEEIIDVFDVFRSKIPFYLK
ncbi:hypothetical protein UJ101_02549 [Flavobacteriaceae bacterium UJ101]|nr:hypothetical protein UJ101_02549 [Flavobacteriaceae bacterium UJ101]